MTKKITVGSVFRVVLAPGYGSNVTFRVNQTEPMKVFFDVESEAKNTLFFCCGEIKQGNLNQILAYSLTQPERQLIVPRYRSNYKLEIVL